VRIELRQSPSAIVLTVEDDGVGISSEALGRASSHGIIGMRQRVAGFGGTLTVSAGRDNKGTQIRAELPLQRALEPRSGDWVQDTRASAHWDTQSR